MPSTFNFQPPSPQAKLNPAQQGDTVFLPFTLPPDWPQELLCYENAQQLAFDLDLTRPGAGALVLVNGSFIFGDFVEALVTTKNYHVKELLIATLSLKTENVHSLRNLVAGGYVDRLGFIWSDWEFNKHRWGLAPYLVEQLGDEGRAQDGRFRFAAARHHCKLVLLETYCGRHLVLQGSANLVSSGNIEQFEITDHPAKYAFLRRYLDALLTKYSVLNTKQPDIQVQKSLTKTQTWQPTAESPKPKPTTSTPPAAPSAARRKAAPVGSVAAAAPMTAGEISPPAAAPSRRSKQPIAEGKQKGK
ncbi:MAG: hypothetical protein ACRYFX_09365 [Janthinobacterium lividum]